MAVSSQLTHESKDDPLRRKDLNAAAAGKQPASRTHQFRLSLFWSFSFSVDIYLSTRGNMGVNPVSIVYVEPDAAMGEIAAKTSVCDMG